jgi:hypothetical protein
VSALGKSGRAIGLCAAVACSLRPILAADNRTFNGFMRSNRLRKMARWPRTGYRNRAGVVSDPEKPRTTPGSVLSLTMNIHACEDTDRLLVRHANDEGFVGFEVRDDGHRSEHRRSKTQLAGGPIHVSRWVSVLHEEAPTHRMYA